MAFELPKLPWAEDALEPFVSAKTIGFHHGKHHAAYVNKTNELVRATPLEGKALDQVVREVAGDPDRRALFNNAAQAWNHDFFWNSLKPKGAGKPSGKLFDLIGETFGGLDKFKEEFAAKATTLFGSGWTWLVKDGEKLSIVQTSGAETPLTAGKVPLFTLDVWEHAYYLDYQNRRPDFIKAVLDNLLNWDFAEENFNRGR